jgi:nitrate/nitrite transporter NarK
VLGAKAVGVSALVLSPTIGGVAIFVAIYGAANGLQTLTRAIVIADLYGAAHYGSISAVVSAVSALGGAVAPFVVAAAIELAGADEPVLWGLVGLSAASAVANEVAVGSRSAWKRGPIATGGFPPPRPELET